MKWKTGRRSNNVLDARGRGGRGWGGGGFRGRGLGLGGLAAVVLISLLLGRNPAEVLGMLDPSASIPSATQGAAPPAEDPEAAFVAHVLGETEDVWNELFAGASLQYQAPKLVLFSRAIGSACGAASSASGPFYCPADQQVYLDMSFFEDMERRLGGGGDFANAYVIAHEVGHHVQTLLGVTREVQAARARGQSIAGAEGMLVRQELQADCFAGVWAARAQARRNWLEAGDLEEALNTASAIGDDRLQQKSQGTVVPDAFTHGTAAQRVRWFKRGFDSGDPGQCDTFQAARL